MFMANYLGNSNTKEVHDLDKQQPGCNIGLINPFHQVSFSSLVAAHLQGYDNCEYCIGRSKR